MNQLFDQQGVFLMRSGIVDYDIQALVDGELEPDEAQRIKCKIEQSQELQKRYEELMHQKILLQQWWQNLH